MIVPLGLFEEPMGEPVDSQGCSDMCMHGFQGTRFYLLAFLPYII